MNNIIIYITFICFIVLLESISGKNFNSDNVTITIDQGTLLGRKSLDFKNNTYYSFEGIPYAKTPKGTLRFKAPEPAEQWTGILNATNCTRICPQQSYGDGVDCSDEDCLLLNIYSKMKSELQPVMVYIHGGGFIFGGMNCNFKLSYGPQFFVQKDVVLVEIQYRLNIFGFLSLDDPKYGISGNAGLKDQIMALKWIQKNIADFAGDPNSVTIFGQSAGGSSVHLLYLSPLANGLFHRAIAQSGAVTNPWVTSRYKTLELADVLECSNKSIDELVNCINGTKMNHLLSRGLDRLRVKNSHAHPGNGKLVYFNILTIEQDNPESFISQNPEYIVKKGEFNKVPIIMGFNSHEGYEFVHSNPVKANFTDARELIPNDLKIDINSNKAFKLGKRIQELYYGNLTPSYQNIDPFIHFLTDSLFVQQIYNFAKLQANKYEHVYFYHFDYWTDLNKQDGYFNTSRIRKPVFHADDLGYMFYSSLKNYKQKDPNIAIGVHRMVKLWTTFAKTGNPNVQNDPLLNVTWLPIQTNKFNYLHINLSLELKVNPIEERMKFWENVYAEYNK
ncbi:juvenile hormone esterase-like [Chrysoperla carnea]|uniref:juvenile hormone esterase-like n=1 Tax=Chrysoperla carnea TaxID=189513 RepID=UPI001D07C9EC|nr:juvenile hormone esterase-like [Chrysoperla carnea]